MARVVSSFDVRGWERWLDVVGPKRFGARLNENVRRATVVNANQLLTRIRASLRRGLRPKNAALTILVKNHNLAGTDTMDLYDALRVWRVGPMSYAVGIPARDPRAKVAAIVHEGAVIRVTEKMRLMFAVLAQVSEGKANPSVLTGRARELYSRYEGPWYPLNEDTEFIKIPRRPFIERFLKQRSFQQSCQKRWQKAVEMAIRGRDSRAGASLGNAKDKFETGNASNDNDGGGEG